MHVVGIAIKNLDSAIKCWSDKKEPWKWAEAPAGRFGLIKRVPCCPVCETPMKYETDYMEHTMLEEHMSCPNHCYSYEFVTGNTRTTIGSIEVYEHYADSKEEREYKNRMTNLALYYEQAEWRKRREQEDDSRRKGEEALQEFN